MRALRKKPGEVWETIEIPNTLEALQQEVGGHIETVTFCTYAAIVCNEEGMLKDLPRNDFLGHLWRGTILMVGVDGDEFCDIADGAIKLFTGKKNVR